MEKNNLQPSRSSWFHGTYFKAKSANSNEQNNSEDKNANLELPATDIKFPPEIWSHILSYLQSQRYLRLRVVCRYFADFLKKNFPSIIEHNPLQPQLRDWLKTAADLARKVRKSYAKFYPKLKKAPFKWSYISSSEISDEMKPMKVRIVLYGLTGAGKRTLLRAIQELANANSASPDWKRAQPLCFEDKASIYISCQNAVVELAFECYNNVKWSPSGEAINIFCCSMVTPVDEFKLPNHMKKFDSTIPLLVITKSELECTEQALPIFPSSNPAYLEVSAIRQTNVDLLMDRIVDNIKHYLIMLNDQNLSQYVQGPTNSKLKKILKQTQIAYKNSWTEEDKMPQWRVIPKKEATVLTSIINTFRIDLIGEGGVGKRSLRKAIMRHYNYNKDSDELIVSFGLKGEPVKLNFHTTDLRNQWSYGSVNNVNIMCFSLHNMDTVYTPQIAHPMLILGTKADRFCNQQVFHEMENPHYLEVSALSDTNIDKILPKIINLISNKLMYFDTSEGVDLHRYTDVKWSPEILPCNDNEPAALLTRVVIVGDQGVGKTKLLHALALGSSSSHLPDQTTNGMDWVPKAALADGKKIELRLCDTQGMEAYRIINSSFYRGASVVLICYSITDQQSAHSASKWGRYVHRYTTEGIVTIVVGTKLDMENQRVVHSPPVEGYPHIEVSAHSYINVKMLLDWIVTSVLSSNIEVSKSIQTAANPEDQELASERKRKDNRTQCKTS